MGDDTHATDPSCHMQRIKRVKRPRGKRDQGKGTDLLCRKPGSAGVGGEGEAPAEPLFPARQEPRPPRERFRIDLFYRAGQTPIQSENGSNPDPNCSVMIWIGV